MQREFQHRGCSDARGGFNHGWTDWRVEADVDALVETGANYRRSPAKRSGGAVVRVKQMRRMR